MLHLPGTYKFNASISHKKQKIRLNLTSLKKYNNFYVKNVIFLRKKMQHKIFIRDRLSPENNVRNNEIMLRKMYKSSELLKCVLGKMPNSLVFLSNKKSSFSHFYLSIPPNILQVLIFFKVLCSFAFC